MLTHTYVENPVAGLLMVCFLHKWVLLDITVATPHPLLALFTHLSAWASGRSVPTDPPGSWKGDAEPSREGGYREGVLCRNTMNLSVRISEF